MKITKQKVQAVADLKAGYTLGHADVAILNELARIALASLEAEPAGWQVKKYGGNWVSIKKEDVDHYRFNEELPVREVYTAPPSPVSVPDEVCWEDVPEEITEDDMALASAWAHGFNQCRAAMLQGGNSPVIPNGWKLVPIDPTKDMLRAGQSVVGFWLNTVHCYSKMLAAAPAAPQQEAE